MNFNIMSEIDATYFIPDKNKYNVLIRITDSSSNYLDLPDNVDYKDILELKFDDLTPNQIKVRKKLGKNTENCVLFTSTMAKKVLSFFQKHTTCDLMNIHCVYGASRSAALAISWCKFKKQQECIDYIYNSKDYLPNPFVIDLMYEQLNKKPPY